MAINQTNLPSSLFIYKENIYIFAITIIFKEIKRFIFVLNVTDLFFVTIIHINPFPNKPLFLRVCTMSALKTLWEKEKLLVTSNFSFSHRIFYLFQELFTVFIKFKIVCLQTLSIWKSQKFAVWERVNN